MKLFLSLVYGLLFATILVLAYAGKVPAIVGKVPYGDKIGHVVLYGLAAYLGQRVLQRFHIKLPGATLPLWPVVFALFTLAEEWLQSTSPARTFSASDAIASLCGICLGYWLSQRVEKSSRRDRPD